MKKLKIKSYYFSISEALNTQPDDKNETIHHRWSDMLDSGHYNGGKIGSRGSGGCSGVALGSCPLMVPFISGSNFGNVTG